MPTKKELKDYCRKKGIKGYSQLNKEQLEKLVNSHKRGIQKPKNFFKEYQKLKTKEERLLIKVKLQKNIIEKQKKLRELRIKKP